MWRSLNLATTSLHKIFHRFNYVPETKNETLNQN